MKKIALILHLALMPIFLFGQDFMSDSAAIKISYGASPDRRSKEPEKKLVGANGN